MNATPAALALALGLTLAACADGAASGPKFVDGGGLPGDDALLSGDAGGGGGAAADAAPPGTRDAAVTGSDAAVSPPADDARPVSKPDATVGPPPDDGAVSPPPDDAAVPPPPDAAPPPGGEPIDAPSGQWTWVDFPDSACNDGSPTGIAVNPGVDGRVLVFLTGGGSCWDTQTCLVLHTTTTGPFGAPQFALLGPAMAATFFNRLDPANPFRGWSYVFVPYCTGDMHGGNHIAQYGPPGLETPFHHVGRANMEAFFRRIAATWPHPAGFAMMGSSAGAFGAALNYPLARSYWPDATGVLIDDSFPLFPGDVYPQSVRDGWRDAWDLTPLAESICAGCADDPSLIHGALAAAYPGDRQAVITSVWDAVISSYLYLTPVGYQLALDDLATQVWANIPDLHAFRVMSATHAQLSDPTLVNQNGVNLFDWLGQAVSGDAAWGDVAP